MPQIKVTVLRSVRVSDDGITNRLIIAGTIDVVPEDALAGLEAEGYVSRGEAKITVAAAGTAPAAAVSEVTEHGLDVRKDKFGRWAVYRDGVRITKSGSEDDARAAIAGLA